MAYIFLLYITAVFHFVRLFLLAKRQLPIAHGFFI
jgi:hypothetical protein